MSDQPGQRDRDLFLNEHRRRVERLWRLANRIEQCAGWLKTGVEDVAPDDIKTHLGADYAENIETDAAEVRRVLGEIQALRDVAPYLFTEGGAA